MYPIIISRGEVRIKTVSVILIQLTEQLRYLADNISKVKLMLNHFSYDNSQHGYRINIFEEGNDKYNSEVCLPQTIFADEPNPVACGLSPGGP